jgi:hypothetical protein
MTFSGGAFTLTPTGMSSEPWRIDDVVQWVGPPTESQAGDTAQWGGATTTGGYAIIAVNQAQQVVGLNVIAGPWDVRCGIGVAPKPEESVQMTCNGATETVRYQSAQYPLQTVNDKAIIATRIIEYRQASPLQRVVIQANDGWFYTVEDGKLVEFHGPGGSCS